MGSKASTLLLPSEIEVIQEETGFTPNQIYRLYSRYTQLDKSSNGYLKRDDFLRIPELAINPLCDRIVNSFFIENGQTTDQVNFLQFTRTLARFLPINIKGPNKLNDRLEKLRFAFNIYDLDVDDRISKEELLNVLRMMVGTHVSEEQLGNIAERTLQEADCDKNGVITFDEFVKIMEKVDVDQRMSIRFIN